MMIRYLIAAGAMALVASDPPGIKPAYDQREVARAHGVGDQIYTCQAKDAAYAWVLKEPEALLFSEDRKVVGRHFAGPGWEWNDKSSIKGKLIASQPSPDPNSIPWLLVGVTEHAGTGTLGEVEAIQRLNTKGGKAPAGGCDAGHVGGTQRVPYEADYVFFAKCRHNC